MLENVYLENLSLLKKHLPEIEKLLENRMQKSVDDRFENVEDFLEKEEVVCVYKMILQEKLLKWLDENQERKIIFLEDDVNRIHFYLYEKKAKAFFAHKRIQIFLLQKDTIKKICWDNIFKKITLITSLSYKKDHNFLKIKKKKEHYQRGIEASFSWYSDLAVKDLLHIYENLQIEKKQYSFTSLKNQAEKIPAIICGAGSSLQKAEEKLKTLKNRAFIFAGGTAMNILSKKNIFYHYGASLEKENLYLRMKMLKEFERPFFYRPVIAPENLQVIEGSLFYVSDHETLPIQRWIEEQLQIESEDMDGGWTVITFLLALAQYMGCDPIILVGVDLCYSKEKYAYDFFKKEEKKKYHLCEEENICGEKVLTQKDFLIAGSWMEEFAQKKRKTSFFNCSKGLALKNMKNISLDALDSFFSKQIDLQNFSHCLTQQSDTIQIAKKEVKKLLGKILLDLQEANGIIAQIIEQWEKEKRVQESILEKLLKEKIIYQFLLYPIWKVWQPFLKQKAFQTEFFSSLEVEKINEMIFMQKIIFSHLDVVSKAYEKI